MRLCRLDDEGWYPVKLPWEYVLDLYQNAMVHIFSFLDKDSKHAIVCKIIHRHKKPDKIKHHEKAKSIEHALRLAGRQFYKSQSDAILESMGASWNCVRCGKECKLNLMIDIDYTPWSDWKKYVKIIEVPKLMFAASPGTLPIEHNKFNNPKNNFWSNIL